MSESLQGNPVEPDQPRRSTWERLGFAVAAVPALFMPVSYVFIVGWTVGELISSCSQGNPALREPAGILLWIGWGGIYANFLQWPLYFAWAAMSRELTWRQRWLWMACIFLLNMFAMPWFLYCKYRGTTSTALTKCIRHQCVRSWFEKKPQAPARR